jgi:translation initiation factor 2B subunit (eIF-2B alpha/beta/delta family)
LLVSINPLQAFPIELDKQLAQQLDALALLVVTPPSISACMAQLRSFITKLSPTLDDATAKASVEAFIDAFVRQRIRVQSAIAQHVVVTAHAPGHAHMPRAFALQQSTADSPHTAALAGVSIGVGDSVVVYRFSDAVLALLRGVHARLIANLDDKAPLPNQPWDSSLTIRVVVIGDRLHTDGHASVQKLAETGIPCSYLDVNAVSHALPSARCVLLGAAAVLHDGSVLAPSGTALICATASCYNIPVYVAAETYKFVDRVLAGSDVFNALEPAAALAGASAPSAESAAKAPAPKAKSKDAVEFPRVVTSEAGSLSLSALPKLSAWRAENASHQVVACAFDVAPARLIAGFVTEAGFVPTAATPVVMRCLAVPEESVEQEATEDAQSDSEEEA